MNPLFINLFCYLLCSKDVNWGKTGQTFAKVYFVFRCQKAHKNRMANVYKVDSLF